MSAKMGAHRAGGWGASRVPIPDRGLRKGLGREGAPEGGVGTTAWAKAERPLGACSLRKIARCPTHVEEVGGAGRGNSSQNRRALLLAQQPTGSQPWCNPRVTWGTLKKYQCPALTQGLLSQKGVEETRRALLDFLKLLGDSNGQPGLRAPELEP